MTAVEWMASRGDALDHCIAMQILILPDTEAGKMARDVVVRSWSARFAHACAEAGMETMKKELGV